MWHLPPQIEPECLQGCCVQKYTSSCLGHSVLLNYTPMRHDAVITHQPSSPATSEGFSPLIHQQGRQSISKILRMTFYVLRKLVKMRTCLDPVRHIFRKNLFQLFSVKISCVFFFFFFISFRLSDKINSGDIYLFSASSQFLWRSIIGKSVI